MERKLIKMSLYQKINQILIENASDMNKAKQEIKKLTRQNFTIESHDGSLFVEFDDPTDNINFGGMVLIEE